MKIKIRVRQFEMIPKWYYGFAYQDYAMKHGICYPIPLNLIVRYAKRVWEAAIRFPQTSSRWELYRQLVEENATLRQELRDMNKQWRQLLDEITELRGYKTNVSTRCIVPGLLTIGQEHDANT